MKKFIIIRSIAFVLIACVSFMFAKDIEEKNYGREVWTSKYGGDAYTGIQNAAAITALNVQRGNFIMKRGFTFLFILTGLGFLAVGLTPLISKNESPTDLSSSNE